MWDKFLDWFGFTGTAAHPAGTHGHLHGSGDALALARLAEQAKPLIVFCASALDAQRLCEEIPYFAPALAVNLLPDWETLPYDSFSPHQDLVSERLATLYAITRGSCDLTLIPASTALYRLAPPAYLAAYTSFSSRVKNSTCRCCAPNSRWPATAMSRRLWRRGTIAYAAD